MREVTVAEYQVSSNKVAGLSFGDVVSEDDLPGVNVAALIEGGHLVPKVLRKAARIQADEAASAKADEAESPQED
jgi:hypothetical protein